MDPQVNSAEPRGQRTARTACCKLTDWTVQGYVDLTSMADQDSKMTRGQDGGHQESVKDSWKEGERRGRLQLHLQEVWSCLQET